ncbi:hypothetical protein L1987_85209 [Smallanthus sonchifolius]|uniref:Uncharacterized protein n=1 Tax=Smallanthus sonchifolius TaxID=185202 RepID=A0ACB8XWK8_9ASTR|nr:hypothetical protein L1987_85209 [Smallanthus sonchifolius]
MGTVVPTLIKNVENQKSINKETNTTAIPNWFHKNSQNPNRIYSSAFITTARSSFKLEHPLERRQVEAARIREKYPDRILVIVEKAERTDIPDIDKKKYLVPADLTVEQFVYVVRKRIKLSAEKAIFIFVKNIMPPTAAMMSAFYEENKDEDGFLYMTWGEYVWNTLKSGANRAMEGE